MNRRNFIQKSAVLLAAGSMAGREMASGMEMATSADVVEAQTQSTVTVTTMSKVKRNKGRIGLQLWSVRPQLADDFTGTLRKISDIGYSSIETFGSFKAGDKFFGHTTKELDYIVKDMGMSICGIMYQANDFLPEDTNTPEWDGWKRCIADLKAVGAKWAVQASIPGTWVKTMDQAKRAAAYFNITGELCRRNGLKLGFHTHPQEFDFIDDICILDYILQNTDPKLFFIQWDMCNVLEKGADYMAYMHKYPGRFPLWHATDYDVEKREIVEVGKGSMNYPLLMAKAKSFGLEQLTVEIHLPDDRLGSCKAAFDYFKQFKWTKV